MALTLNTNTSAITAQRHLDVNDQYMNRTLERLSSGKRINRAADDPAGLAVADALNAKTRSLGQGIRNAHDGISLVQVFEGGTNEINNMLIRIRELSTQAASDTIGAKERGMVNVEVQQIIEEITRVANTTEYAGTKLLSGASADLDFQVGVGNNPEVDRIHFNPGDANLTASSLGIAGLDLIEKEDAQTALDTIDNAIARVNEVRVKIGSVQSRLNSTVVTQQIFNENLLAARSRIADADFAVETTALAKANILRQSSVAILSQANNNMAVALQLLK